MFRKNSWIRTPFCTVMVMMMSVIMSVMVMMMLMVMLVTMVIATVTTAPMLPSRSRQQTPHHLSPSAYRAHLNPVRRSIATLAYFSVSLSYPTLTSV
jgi:ABC-type bacteriocin/lantibiotic exporter with double-glycine peptidase domain